MYYSQLFGGHLGFPPYLNNTGRKIHTWKISERETVDTWGKKGKNTRKPNTAGN
jgi:hypothetical protein